VEAADRDRLRGTTASDAVVPPRGDPRDRAARRKRGEPFHNNVTSSYKTFFSASAVSPGSGTSSGRSSETLLPGLPLRQSPAGGDPDRRGSRTPRPENRLFAGEALMDETIGGAVLAAGTPELEDGRGCEFSSKT